MKSEIIQLIRIWDDQLCKYYWQITLETEEPPDIKMGECVMDIKQ